MGKKKVEVKYPTNWIVSFEYQHGKDLIIPGTEIKFKGQRGTFKFNKFVTNKETGKKWIDCTENGVYSSFYIETLKGIIKPKKKRINKDNV
jgi:hypothetical protein